MERAMEIEIEQVAYAVQFRRRRYGRVTYTWASVELAGETVSLGDPWPAVTPKRSEVQATLRGVLVTRGVIAGPTPTGPEQGY
jgi:hypothetical protein